MPIIMGLDPNLPLVDRLRLAPERLSNVGPVVEKLMTEAATEIERLRAALKRIADWKGDIHSAGWEFHNIATVAIDEQIVKEK